MTDTVVSTDRLEQRLLVLADTKRLVRFALRFVAPEEHELGREKLAKFRPLISLANYAMGELDRKGFVRGYVDHKDNEALCSVIREAIGAGAISSDPTSWPNDVYLSLYPHFCAQVIALSNGYAMPDVAAIILKDGKARRQNGCEWVDHDYRQNAFECIKGAAWQRDRIAKSAAAVRAKPADQRRPDEELWVRSVQKRGKLAVAKTLLGFEHMFAAWF